MGNRLTKIYTKTGDDGTTGLGDGSRVAKDHPRVEACGSIDETNSQLGLLLCQPNLPKTLIALLTQIQHELFDLGGEISIPGTNLITENHVKKLEQHLDELNNPLPALKEFILPGGTMSAAICHVARSTCRRAERRLITLTHQATINHFSLQYLNRLSDLLFVIARVLALSEGNQEIYWQHERVKKNR